MVAIEFPQPTSDEAPQLGKSSFAEALLFVFRWVSALLFLQDCTLARDGVTCQDHGMVSRQ